jgi:chorismate lyase/3-hydroxybenzoate synthase
MTRSIVSLDRSGAGSGRVVPAVDSRPPAWAFDAVQGVVTAAAPGMSVPSANPLLLHTRVETLTNFSSDDTRVRVAGAFTLIRSVLSTSGRQAVRFWNFVPGLNCSVAAGVDRYMVFNAGRYDAFAADLSSAPPAATASAVGVDGDSLDVYCLATPEGGRPIENPRQKSSWLYSARYGPLPPYFARATLATLHGRVRLLIGGTASIVGEDSTHQRSISGQVDETLANLAAVVRSAGNETETDGQSLARLREIRAYVRREEDGEIVARALATCSPEARVELTRACICRPELLVEIEAVADL